MIYITGEKETLASLQEVDVYAGSAADFRAELCRLNRHIDGETLKPYTAVQLIGGEQGELSGSFVQQINAFSAAEREALWRLQESKMDLPTLVAMQDLMDEFRSFTGEFIKKYDDPLIKQPWLDSSSFLTNGSLLDILPGMTGVAAGTIRRMRQVGPTEELFEALSSRDALNTRIARLMGAGRGRHYLEIQRLERAAKGQTAKIKQLLPKKLNDTLVKYLTKRGVDVYKTRNNAYSLKMAKKGRSATLALDLLNKTGLDRSKAAIRSLIRVGSAADKLAFWAGPAVTLYNTAEAYKAKRDFGKVFVSGMASFGTGVALTSGSLSFSAWGACAIGMLAGDAALGSLLLASSPVWGTALIIVVGVAVVGYATYQASNLVEHAWDSEWGKEARAKVSSAFETVEKKLEEGFMRSEAWFHRFFAHEPAGVELSKH